MLPSTVHDSDEPCSVSTDGSQLLPGFNQPSNVRSSLAASRRMMQAFTMLQATVHRSGEPCSISTEEPQLLPGLHQTSTG
ncbi:hypothetical protein BV898_02706 [Hypsibius exemplaris]|uniref:Uncharacterized protein n=1 Tax=Hypsibius exemplaris TaxID=2072580 RepID=A0A1W0X7T3_HYPEX|nr:hypothetical protein BV898_02706 [Hypsibius exemplaris]